MAIQMRRGQSVGFDPTKMLTGEWIKTSAYNLTWEQFKVSTETPAYLCSAFLKNFERAGVEVEETRKEYARKWYDFLSTQTGVYIVKFVPS